MSFGDTYGMNKKTKTGFKCAHCGEWHNELLKDLGSQLPDDVWSLSYVERYQRARHNADLCTLGDKRHFIRCVLPVPMTYTDDQFCWGLWIEVSRKDHDQYIRTMQDGADKEFRFEGLLANNLKAYARLIGQKVTAEVKARSADRPLIRLSPASRHKLAIEQRKGIDLQRHHELVAPYL
jgi:hypothetical protein